MYLDSGVAYATIPHQTAEQKRQNSDAAILRSVVRGESGFEAITKAGIRIGDYCAKKHTSPLNALPLRASDLAEGMLALKDDPAHLSDWASFIVMISDSVVFEDECGDYGERFLSCIWDFAFGGKPADASIRLARAIRKL